MRDYDGKTAAQRVADRRRRLIEAGYELFGEHGYAGTSVRAVLRRSGLQDRYFAESFADLDSLLAAVYERIIDEELIRCRAAIDAAGGSSASARAMIDALTRALEGDRPRARIKLREVLSAGPVTRRQRRKGLYNLAELVAELLPPTPSSAGDPLLLALGVVATANELLITWLDGERGLTRQGVVDAVTFMFDAVADRMAATPTATWGSPG
ncbi:TetR/AcrR family transcriptional regulator [Pseudonocardia xinjiangensis]|uniref:TetR/AcrR family transcriptional regulator n=1 Tax=Pseudonocardia xinjiangensis TaxID=75289 RepID=UPI003D8B13DD